jgi:hypothetical protein
MKKVSFLCEHRGEYSGTPHTIAKVYEEGSVNLEEKVMRLCNSDFWIEVPVNKYAVCTIELPDWMSEEEYIRNWVDWKYVWGRGCSKEWPEKWQRFFCQVSAEKCLAMVKLLKVKKFKSEFRKSLRIQLEEWLNSEERKYPMPFSPKQWSTLVDPYLKNESYRLENNLYRSSRSIY